MTLPLSYFCDANEMKGFYAKVTTVRIKVNVKFPNVRKHNRICITIALLITLATPLRSHVRSDVRHTLNQMRNVKIYAKQRKLIITPTRKLNYLRSSIRWERNVPDFVTERRRPFDKGRIKCKQTLSLIINSSGAITLLLRATLPFDAITYPFRKC